MRPLWISRWGPAFGLGVVTVVAAGMGFVVSRPPAAAQAPEPLPPAPRSSFGYSVADDPAHDEILVFGGVDSYSSTWLWDRTRWEQQHPQATPPGRFGAPAAYDPDTGVVMLYGGRLDGGQPADDTWAWDGTNWDELDAGTRSPPAGEGATMVWDRARRQMVLALPVATAAGLGGETWVWSRTRWTRLRDGAFPRGIEPVAAAWDTVTSSVIAVGAETNLARSTAVLSFVTLQWDGSAWRVLDTTHHLSSYAGLARDPRSGTLLVAAGNGQPPASATDTAWSWTGTDWKTITGSNGPPWPGAAVSDTTASRVLLVGTVTLAYQGAPQRLHVWEWDGSRWRRQDSGG